MIASAGASRNSVGWRCGSIRSAPPSKRMNTGSFAGSVTSATDVAPVPSVSSTAALRLDRLARVGQRGGGRGGVVEHDQLELLRPSPAISTPPSSLISSTASWAPRSIEPAIHGSVETGALTTTCTAVSSLAAAGQREATSGDERRAASRSGHDGGKPGSTGGGSHVCTSGDTGRPAVRRPRAVRRRLRRRRAVRRVRRRRQAQEPTAEGRARARPRRSASARRKRRARPAARSARRSATSTPSRSASRPTTSRSSTARTSTSPRGRSARPSASSPRSTATRARWRPSATRPPTRSCPAATSSSATDQEEGTEAEAHLSGTHTVDIQVITLCAGKLRIRYTVS